MLVLILQLETIGNKRIIQIGLREISSIFIETYNEYKGKPLFCKNVILQKSVVDFYNNDRKKCRKEELR